MSGVKHFYHCSMQCDCADSRASTRARIDASEQHAGPHRAPVAARRSARPRQQGKLLADRAGCASPTVLVNRARCAVRAAALSALATARRFSGSRVPQTVRQTPGRWWYASCECDTESRLRLQPPQGSPRDAGERQVLHGTARIRFSASLRDLLRDRYLCCSNAPICEESEEPTLTVGTDNETSVPKTSPLPKRQTRSESRIASYVIPSILEPPRADDSEPEESLTGPIVAQDRAAWSLAKGPASKGPPKTADRRRGQPSVAESGHTSVHAPGVAGNPRIQWDVIEDEELSAVPRLTPKAIGPPSLRRGGPCAN